jgi:cytochrome c oxidase cbb3-type subunit 3
MSEGNRHDEIQGEIIHVYDGIEEADNELPLWWLFTFYGAVVFAVFYWFYYEGFEVGDSPMQAYTAELAASAGQGGEVTDESLEELATDSAAVAAGNDIFQSSCAACHRNDAGGMVGPNLTDPNWIHGGSPTDIHTTIRDGFPAASMPAWGAVLGPVAVQQVTAFVMSVRNTNVDGKEPQGEIWSPDGADGEGAAAPGEDGVEGDAGVEAAAVDADGGAPSPADVPAEGAEADAAADAPTADEPTAED